MTKSDNKTRFTKCFLVKPFETKVLYQCLLRQTWKHTDITQMRVATICATAQLCHTSWLLPCPAICKHIPVIADETNANGNNFSNSNDIFTARRVLSNASNLLNTPLGHALTHLPQPMQALASLNTTCLCHKNRMYR